MNKKKMTKLKIFFIGLSALIILSSFGYKYWQTQPSYSLLQIQESIESDTKEIEELEKELEELEKEFEDLP